MGDRELTDALRAKIAEMHGRLRTASARLKTFEDLQATAEKGGVVSICAGYWGEDGPEFSTDLGPEGSAVALKAAQEFLRPTVERWDRALGNALTELVVEMAE